MRPRQLKAVKIGQTALDAIMALDTRAEQDALSGDIVRYWLTGEEPPASSQNAIVWKMIVSEVDRIRKAEAAISEARAAAGKRGGFAKAARAAAASQEAEEEDQPAEASVANVANVANATNVANVANVAKLAIRIDKNRIDKNRIDKRESTARAREDGKDDPFYDPEAPMSLAEAKSIGETIGLLPAEVEGWYNRYGADHWRFKPDSSDKMTRKDAVYCMANWRARRDEFRAKENAKQGQAGHVASYLPPEEGERHEDF